MAAWLAYASPPASAALVADEVHYTFTSATSVAIDWRGEASDVRWGETPDYGRTAVGSAPAWTPISSPGPFWQLELGGLVAGATYHYSIGGGPDYLFSTPPTGNFRFDAIGDVGDTVNFSKLGATLDRIASDDPAFVLMIGDLTYANAPGSSQAAVDQHFNDVMRWSTKAAYMPAWGNHEYDVAGADDLRNYKGRLLMPNAAASPGSPAISCCGDDWGWFDAGTVRFIAYPEPWTGAWADWQSHANTLMRQAQNDPAIKYVVTYGHRPAYSTGSHAGETQIASILDAFGDTYSKFVLNLNGHSHNYERFQPIHGVTHVTVGAPSSVAPWTSADPRTAFRASHLSHLRVDVGDDGLRLQTICDDPANGEDITCSAGSVIDQYIIGTPPPTPPTADYYVDKTSPRCSDSGAGRAGDPFCTLTKGVSRLLPGATLFVGDGTYAETIKPSVSGNANDPVTITAWPGRNPVIGNGVSNAVYLSSRAYITISNLTFDGTTGDAVYLSKSNHIVLSGNHVTRAGLPSSGKTARGIYIKSTTDSLVTANTISRVTDAGIYVTTGSTRVTVSYNSSSLNAAGYARNGLGIWVNSSGNTILGNVTHDNEDSGIQFTSGGDDNLIALNVSYLNGDHGIDNLNVRGGRIVGNTVYRNCTSGINVEGTSGSYLVENNVAVDNAVYPAYAGISCNRRSGNIGIWDSAPPTTTVDHNLVWLSKPGTMYVYGSAYASLDAMRAATGQETRGVQGDPRFLDASVYDLQLGAGSPAIDRGNSGASGQQEVDLLGYPRRDDPATPNTFARGPRAYDDLGAYEFQPEAAPPDAVAPVAALSVTPNSGEAPHQVLADASGSTGAPGETLTYTFDFGDGTPPTGPQPGTSTPHTYTAAGTYTARVTVRGATGLTDTAQRTITVTAPPDAVPPVAALSVTPNSGEAPHQVLADASGSTGAPGETLTYTFDFGDGTPPTGPQPGTSTPHTYTAAGTYTARVTVRGATGLTDTAQRTITVTAPPPPPPPGVPASYVNQVATNYSTATKTSGYLTVWRPAGVQAGDLVVVTLQLTGTAPTGAVSGTDSAGNNYALASSVSDSAGNRLVVLSGVATQALSVNDRITATFPSATAYRIVADEFAGVTSVDRTSSASGSSAGFSSGATPTTRSPNEVVFGAVALPSATANPSWATPWRDAGSYAVGPRYLGRSYQLPTTTGSFNANGSAVGPWLATTVTFQP